MTLGPLAEASRASRDLRCFHLFQVLDQISIWAWKSAKHDTGVLGAGNGLNAGQAGDGLGVELDRNLPCWKPVCCLE